MDTKSRLTSRPAIVVYGAIAVVVAVFVGALFVAPLMATSKSSNAGIAAYNVDADSVAIHGYDTVAYFTENKPVKGKSEFEYTWEAAKWRFASATNRDLFKANPDRYAPRYGGYCSLGVAVGEYSDTDPEAFTIYDGKLYLSKVKRVREVWRKAPEAYLLASEYNWEKFRGELRINDNLQ